MIVIETHIKTSINHMINFIKAERKLDQILINSYSENYFHNHILQFIKIKQTDTL